MIDRKSYVSQSSYDHGWRSEVGGPVNPVAVGEVDGEPVVISGSWDNTVRLWNARTGLPRGEPLIGHTGNVNAVALGQVNGKPVVVSGSWDHTVRLWDLCSRSLLRTIPLRSQVIALAMGKDSRVALCAKAGLMMLDF